MTQTQKELGAVLLEQGLVTPEQLNAANEEEARSGRSAWKVLLESKVLGEKDLLKARAVQIGMPFADLDVLEPSEEAIALVPEEVARRQQALPLGVEEGNLVIAMADPRNHLGVEEISKGVGMPVLAAVAHRPDLLQALDKVYGAGNGAATSLLESLHVAPEAASVAPTNGNHDGASAPSEIDSFKAEDLPMVEAAAPTAPAEAAEEELKEPNLADFLIAVLEGKGSDLHLTAGLPPTIRVNGELAPLKGYRSLLPKDLQEIIYSMLTQKQREIFEENLELDVSYALPGKARFRVNVFQQRDSLASVMRLIPYEIKTVDDLGLPDTVKEFANLRRGLVLVTGITGSGKSTTLAALIDMINTERAEHIMTVEDPIEFLHKHKRAVVNQREVGTDTYGFGEALKRVLRQDPDVILVGEMRDLETISTALTAAETGHLVFGTLHTQDAPQSIDRVIDVFPPHQQQQIRVQISGTIAGVVSQQLLPTADGKSRAVAAEVMVATPAIRNLIREGKTHQIYTSMQAGAKFGMQVMDQHLAELVKKGKITYEMGLERSHHPEEYNRLVGKG
jgi:twitching motility protein PilT